MMNNGGQQVKEVRIHGRGGQGSVTAAELLAVAAFEDGKYSQAFHFLALRDVVPQLLHLRA
jgi:Pyruvate/2-oxoacid:ferredoxin oxidoreductase gamma subunit